MLCTSQELRARRVLMLLYVCPRTTIYFVLKLRVFCFSQELLARERAAAEKERKLEKASTT